MRSTGCQRARYCLSAMVTLILCAFIPLTVQAQQTSVSAWDAAEFRIWGYIPYWGQSHINGFATNGMYTHVSDVLLFGGVRPDSNGNLTTTHPTALSTLRTLSATHGFKLHLSMMEPSSGSVDAVWTSIVNSSTKRATFVNNAKNLMIGNVLNPNDDIKGFNFDWERPRDWDRPPGTPENDAIAASLWGNYTQLARELGTAFDDPLTPNTNSWEVTVCDYGSTDYRWDNTALFDAKVYDQLFVMSYHLTASSTASYAGQKPLLNQQGPGTEFSNDQIALGFGTWGKGVDPPGPDGPPGTVPLSTFVAANPTLAYDVLSITGTYNDVGGNQWVNRTWNIESRKQVREKTQVALSAGMPGMFSWTMHYDATNNLGLHRVVHHYTVFQRGVPDLNLDGKLDATDANTLANNMGTVPGWTGTNTAERFDDFYLSGNWEQGDRDGNGFVNQPDADWLAARYAALGVNLPDRLAYSGTLENFQNSRGLTGRWRAKREAGGNLRETGNYAQHGSGFLAWSGTGVGASKRSDSFVTLRNQNAAEAFDSINTLPRMMQVDVTTPIDTSQAQETYFTFLVRSNTAPLLASKLSSNNRTLSLEFLDSAGTNQFDFTLRGLQQQFAIQSQADAAGQDASAGGFAPNTTYLFVGKIAGNGAGANTMQASLFASGAAVGNFANPSFTWMLTADGSAGFDPLITQLQFSSLYEANYTVSNVWIGTAADLFALPSAAMGDFNADGTVDSGDYLVWRKTMGESGDLLAADGDGNGQIDAGDYDVWRAHFGQSAGAGAAADSPSSFANRVPEPASMLLTGMAALVVCALRCGSRDAHGRMRRGGDKRNEHARFGHTV